MVAEIHQLKTKPATINWMCSSCGVDAGCNCGAPLMSKAQRAKEAIEAAPHKSDRAIAAELGISQPTVSKARKETTDKQLSVDEEMRVGLDGRQRRLPVRRPVIDDDNDSFEAATPSQLRDSFLVFSNEALLLAQYVGPVDQVVLESAKATAAAWCRLVETLEKRK